jgi:hypothetical protein
MPVLYAIRPWHLIFHVCNQAISDSDSSPMPSASRAVKSRQRGSTFIPVRKDGSWRTRLARAAFAIIVLGTLFSIPILIILSFSKQFTFDNLLEF